MSRRSPVRRDTRAGKARLIIDFFYVDSNGKKRRYRRDAHAQTMTAARAEADRLIDLVARTGSPVATGTTPTFAAFVDDVFRPIIMPRMRAGTRQRYEALFRQHVLAGFGRKRLDEIDWLALQRFAAQLRAHGVDPRGAGNLVRSVIRSAVEAGVVKGFPRLPSFPQSPKLPEAPGVDEVSSVMAVAKGWLRPAVALSVYGGLRSAEVRGLQVGDVDFAAGCLWVRRAFSADELGPPKTGKQRAIPMAPELAEALKPAVRSKLPQAHVVTTRNGTVPSRQALLMALNRAQDRAGLPRRSFHLLRHFFCSRLLQVGANIEAVRRLAGHEMLSTTARYVHAVSADMSAAIDRLSGNRRETP